MQQIQLNYGAERAYFELEQVQGMAKILLFTMDKNSDGYANKESVLRLSIMMALDEIERALELLEPMSESETAPISNVVNAGKLISVLEYKFNMEITQNYMPHESDYKTDLDNHISQAVYGLNSIVCNVAKHFFSATETDQAA